MYTPSVRIAVWSQENCVDRARPTWRSRWQRLPQRRAIQKALMVLLPLGTIFSALLLMILISLYRTSGEFRFYAYYERLLPRAQAHASSMLTPTRSLMQLEQDAFAFE